MIGERVLFRNISAYPTLFPRIKDAQEKDVTLQKRRDKALKGELPGYSIRADRILRYQDRVYLPRDKEKSAKGAHCSKYTVHPENNKMYHDLKQKFCWDNIKREIAQYNSRCLTCQQVKAEHQKPTGLLIPLEVPE